MRKTSIEIHHYDKRLERAARYLKNHPKVTEENKTQILKFLDRIKAEGLSLARQVSYVQWLTTIAASLPAGKSFVDMTKVDVERLVGGLNGRNWSDSTKENHLGAIKRFWRWLKKFPDGDDPPETDWFKVGKGKGRKLLPEELLTREEAHRIVEVAERPGDKAYASVSDESGGRPEEILGARIRNVQFDDYGAILLVGGKMGMRRIRLIRSAPLLALWLDNHPYRDDPDAPLWVNIGTTRHGR